VVADLLREIESGHHRELIVAAFQRVEQRLPYERIALVVAEGLVRLPELEPHARDVFTKMRDSHLRSIAACESVLKTLS
jgi:hypothetical protein